MLLAAGTTYDSDDRSIVIVIRAESTLERLRLRRRESFVFVFFWNRIICVRFGAFVFSVLILCAVKIYKKNLERNSGVSTSQNTSYFGRGCKGGFAGLPVASDFTAPG